jgi:hypothetical protein
MFRPEPCGVRPQARFPMPSIMKRPFLQRHTRKPWMATSGLANCIAVAGLWLVASPAPAQDWARAMFNHTSHDFGVVARGAKAEYRFTIENIYEEDVNITSVSSSCGCSTPRLSRKHLKTWEKAELLVTVDTRAFLGRKDATITVVFDQPFPAEVQLHVHTYIRSDIVVQPGAVLFGSVMQGAGASQVLLINYAGRDDWRISRVECANPAIEATVAETNRAPGSVGYRLSVKLKPDAPPGYVRDQLILVTNDYDARAARVPVAVEGLVIAALSVRPSPLMMGVAEIGRPVTRNLVVQGRAPFRVMGIYPSDKRFQCKVPGDAKLVHVVPVTFLADDAKSPSGVVDAKIRITTDLGSADAVDVGVSVQVAPAQATKP